MSDVLIPGEKLIGVWRRSAFTFGFWRRLIGSLGIYYFALWQRNQIVLTDHRVVQRTGGIIAGREVSISIDNVSNVDLNTTTMGAIFDYGDISIEAVNSQRPEIVFDGLAHAKRLRDEIIALQASASPQSGKTGAQSQPLQRAMRS